MSRSFPIFLATVLVAGVVRAEAHQSTIRISSPRMVSGSFNFAASAAAQADDVAAKVKAALKADSELGSTADAITVTGAGGVVTIEGTVPTVQVRAKIGEFVQKVDGVTKLVNKLKLAKK